MMRATIAVVLALAAHAQQQPAARVEFEVCSVKPGDPADPSSSARTTPGGLQMRNTTLKTLVRSAYQLNEYQLDGGPKWIDSQRFNIDAKLPAGVARDQIPLMMRALLEDRFKLAFHRETKILPEYELVIATGGPKLQVASEDDRNSQGSSQGDRQIKGRGIPMSTLANMLISAVGAPVLDRTALDGKYNFSLAFAPLFGTPREDETLPTIFAVLVEQLGLKLERTKGPVEILVIDRVEKPTEN
jgi:uncharacterized protein (TIGR03435 family)